MIGGRFLSFSLPKSSWDYIVQFWYLDLSLTDTIMQECYSIFGPEPRLPSCMLRSYLLALKLKVTSITQWCRMLRETPLYAILSGFSVGDTPGIGTFYDFFSRMWKGDSNNLSPKDRFPKLKVPKGKKKGDKTPCDSSSVASKLLPLMERWHSANIRALTPNMEGLYIFTRVTIQDSLTYRQETVRNGKRNITEELPWNVPTNVRKKAIN